MAEGVGTDGPAGPRAMGEDQRTVFRLHLRTLLLEQVRTPLTVLANLLMPVLGYISCVLLVPELVVTRHGTATLAQFWVLAALSNSLFTVAMTVAQDRETCWGQYLRTLPAPRFVRFGALLSTVLLMAVAAAVGVLVEAVLLLERPPSPWLLATGLLWLLPAGAPFALFGFGLGRALPFRAVLPVAQAVFLAAAFGGGLLLPANLVQRVSAPAMPTTAASEIITAYLAAEPLPAAAFWSLLGWTLAALLVAVLLTRVAKRSDLAQ